MDIRTIDDEYSVSGQIQVSDINTISDFGFKTIICNRPDEEAVDQPPHKDIFAAAQQVNLKCFFVPVYSTGLSHANVDALKLVLEEAERPIFAYCRSGARSTMIYNVAKNQ
jgi:uncharacterized protein (TIGR01244 family)